MENQAGRPTAWRFADLFDIEHIQRLQDAFAEAHHVSAVITDPGGTAITRISHRSSPPRPTGGEIATITLDGAATVDHDWSGAAPIIVESAPLAEWRIHPTPGMAPERFERVCGFLEQAAELVSQQARMQVQLDQALEARQRAEEDCRRLENQLRQSTGMLAVGRLAGGVAHDFGNLLTAITGYAEQLTDQLDDPEDPEAPAVRILSAADRASDLVQRLLEVARQGVAREREVDLVALVSEVVLLLEKAVPASVRITQTVDGEIGAVEGDASCLHAALMNLGINAGHAMARTGGELIFTQREVRCQKGQCVEVRVRDTGEGMDPETCERIFDPFFTTRHGSGSGLGLTQARQCIEEHGGSITVESQPGQGTVFTIRLPLIDSDRRYRQAAC